MAAPGERENQIVAVELIRDDAELVRTGEEAVEVLHGQAQILAEGEVVAVIPLVRGMQNAAADFQSV